MRHSSWTLFLVPLSIPLVLLGFFWAIGSLDQRPGWGGEAHGVVQGLVTATAEADGGGARAGEGIVEGKAEALQK